MINVRKRVELSLKGSLEGYVVNESDFISQLAVWDSGCEAIAVYNALCLAGKPTTLSGVIDRMEELFFKDKWPGGYCTRGLLGATKSDISNVLTQYGVEHRTMNYTEMKQHNRTFTSDCWILEKMDSTDIINPNSHHCCAI